MFLCCVHAPDINECKEKRVCKCSECKCKDTWGGYECSCSGGLLYMQEHDTCISKYPESNLFWLFDEIRVGGASSSCFHYPLIATLFAKLPNNKFCI